MLVYKFTNLTCLPVKFVRHINFGLNYAQVETLCHPQIVRRVYIEIMGVKGLTGLVSQKITRKKCAVTWFN